MTVPITAYVAESGTLLIVRSGDFSQVVSASGPAPVVKVNGTAHTLGVACYTDRTQTYGFGYWCVCYRLPVRVRPGDSVTWSVGPIYAFAGGGVNATQADAPVTNHSGVPILAFASEPGPRRIRAGWQFNQGFFWGSTPIFADETREANTDWGDGYGSSLGTRQGGWDANGYPAAATSQVEKIIAREIDLGPNAPVFGMWQSHAPGAKHVLWRGDAKVSLWADGSSTSVEDESARTTVGLWNYRKYTTGRGSDGTLQYKILADCTGGKTLADLRVLDAAAAPDPWNPPEFSPWALYQLGGVTLLRLKDTLNTDGGASVVDYDDFAGPGWASNSQTAAKYRCEVASIDTVDSGPFTQGRRCIRLTFKTPHPYHAGQTVFVQVPQPPWGNPAAEANLDLADGTTAHVYLGGTFYPQTPTTGIWSGYVQGFSEAGEPELAVNDLSSAGAFGCVFLNAPAPDALARFVTQAGPDCAGWVNIPHAATDDCAYRMGLAFARFYHPGNRKIPLYVEWSNECWNGAAGYPQCYYVRAMAAAAGLTPGQWYALRSAQARAAFRRGWVDGGRDAGQVREVVNVQPSVNSWVRDVLEYSATHDLTGAPTTTAPLRIDMVAHANYLQVILVNSAIADELDQWTVEQVQDYLHEFMWGFDFTAIAELFTKPLRAYLPSTAYAGVALGLYEAGPQDVLFSGTRSSEHTRSAFLHPRWRFGQTRHIQYWDEQGHQTYVKMGASGPLAVIASEGGGLKAYSCVFSYAARAGTGDGTDGEFNNLAEIANPDGSPRKPDVRRLCSPVMWALKEWCRKAPPPGPRAPTLPDLLAAAKGLAAAVAADEADDDARLAEARARVKRLEADLAAARPAAG